MSGRSTGIFDGLPIPADKSYLREGLSRIDESWAAARFDSLPHVVHILTSRDREGEIQFLKEQSVLIEDVVDEVVHAYHHGFNKAIQNYSQILRLFSESAESISSLKTDMAEARKLLGSRNKQLHQLWYRSLTLRHILSLLDQIEGVAKVPSRIEKLIGEKQLYAAVQLHVQSMVMLEREGLQVVGALQDVRTELMKLRGVLFFKILEELHSHLYNKGEYSSGALSTFNEDEIPTATIGGASRRSRSMRGESQFGAGSSLLSSIDGGSSIEEESSVINGNTTKDSKSSSHETPPWLSFAVPDEFIEIVKKSEASTSEKYLQTLVECLCMLGKIAAAGAILCQRLRPTIHDIMTTEIKLYFQNNSSKSRITEKSDFYSPKGFLEGHNKLLLKNKNKNGTTFNGAQQQIASPISPLMTPTGEAQCAASDLLTVILNSIIHILENHFIVGELLEVKSTQGDSINTPKSTAVDPSFSTDSEASQVTGGYSVSFPLTVVQSECQQLICEILRATPEAATADAAVQTARLANKSPAKDKRDGSEGLSFAFRITDAALSVQNEGQGWKRGGNAQQEGYGTASVLPDQGIYLAASVYRPVLQFTDKIKSLLPQKYSQHGNDGLLSFVENFLKDHFLPAIFVDYRKCVQQAISTPAAFRPRVQATSSAYSPLVGKGRPVLQGLLAVDFLAKEVLGWAQLMPKYASELVEYVRTFLERTYERCRTSYMEVVLERQSYMLLGRSDVEGLMRLEPANAILQNSGDQNVNLSSVPDGETMEVERQISDLLLNLRPIKQENLIHDDQKLILLASLSDSLEYLADSIERLGDSFISPSSNTDGHKPHHHRRSSSAVPKSLATLSNEYRKLAIDCLKVLRLEMQLETILHMQEMTNREYLEDQDADEPDDFIISLTSLITRRDEEMAPFVSELKRNYIFGGISSVAANASIKALSEIRSINLLGVQQICRNSIALEQALAAIPSMDSEGIQTRLDTVRKYYELLNLPFESLIAYVAEHSYMFFPHDISSLLRVDVPGREIPGDAERRMAEILSH